MRFHLLVQRHGLPVTRILWTTSPPSLFDADTRSSLSAPSSSLPNGGYTIAQLLEDVNEVLPLETEVGLFENESGGQWGLEDYAVEVGGSECLHFMEVDGLLRDGDEVVIRALQLPDLRARRLAGRHQISADGKHLIDGVPFGRPFLKKAVSSRPGIAIPPRKKRRTLLSRWGRGVPDNEEDAEWDPRGDELCLVPDEDSDEDSDVHRDIRDIVDDQVSESDADESDVDEDDLADELKDLKEDLEPDSHEPETTEETLKYSLRKNRASGEDIRSGSTRPALSAPKETPENHSPKVQKSVRFSEGKAPVLSEVGEPSDESDSSISDSSCSDTSSDDDSPSDTNSSDSDSSEEPDSKEEYAARTKRRKTNPPGTGSAQTRKSNRRNKMRRRLAKLKELGILDEDADFAALRNFDDTYKGPIPIPGPSDKTSAKDKEQAEFEAKREKLLHDLESGGVDVDTTSEKENVPPGKGGRNHAEVRVCDTVSQPSELATEPVQKRLDVASTKRLLFGSLGVRTPRSKEDEQATREKLAGKARQFQSQRDVEEEAVEEPESESEVDWEDKLILKATECVVEGIELKDPPFPFQQRWDFEAQNIIRQRKGLGKKRKRGLQLDGEAGDQEYDDDYINGEGLNYDDVADEVGEEVNADADDLPNLPDNLGSLADLVESEVKKGMIIAFKQLDMSKATNWQPKISEYQTAETHSDLEDGRCKIRLAKRDRQQMEVGEGEEGERHYSGFEMPGFEDDEDDGFREVAFTDLIEPKVLREVDVGVGEESNPLQSASENVDAAMTSELQSKGDLAQDQSVEDQLIQDQTQDQLMKDQDADPKESQEKRPVDEAEEWIASPVIRSPTFTGFHTSSSDPSSDVGDGDDCSPVNQDADGEPRLPPSNQDAALPSPTPLSDRPPEIGRDIISSPKSSTSFDRILDDFIQGSRREASLDNEEDGERLPSASSEPPDEFVPNPLPESAKTEERRASEELQDSLNDEDLKAELQSRHRSPDHQEDAEQRESDKSIAESDWPGKNAENSQAQQTQTGDVVDLTQDSPAASLNGDDDFARSEQLPRGPGWVQKNVPASQRETRSSRRVQVMKEVSISPTNKGRKV